MFVKSFFNITQSFFATYLVQQLKLNFFKVIIYWTLNTLISFVEKYKGVFFYPKGVNQ